jgi:hypothetical protein
MNRWHLLPAQVYALVEHKPATVLLECAPSGGLEPWSRLFILLLSVTAANSLTIPGRLHRMIQSNLIT